MGAPLDSPQSASHVTVGGVSARAPGEHASGKARWIGALLAALAVGALAAYLVLARSPSSNGEAAAAPAATASAPDTPAPTVAPTAAGPAVASADAPAASASAAASAPPRAPSPARAPGPPRVAPRPVKGRGPIVRSYD